MCFYKLLVMPCQVRISTLSLTSRGIIVVMKRLTVTGGIRYLLTSVLTITTLMAFIISRVYFCAEDFWNRFFDLPTDFVDADVLIGLLVSPARDFWLSRQRYEVKYKGVVMVSSGYCCSWYSIIYYYGDGSQNKRGMPRCGPNKAVFQQFNCVRCGAGFFCKEVYV